MTHAHTQKEQNKLLHQSILELTTLFSPELSEKIDFNSSIYRDAPSYLHNNNYSKYPSQ